MPLPPSPNLTHYRGRAAWSFLRSCCLCGVSGCGRGSTEGRTKRKEGCPVILSSNALTSASRLVASSRSRAFSETSSQDFRRSAIFDICTPHSWKVHENSQSTTLHPPCFRDAAEDPSQFNQSLVVSWTSIVKQKMTSGCDVGATPKIKTSKPKPRRNRCSQRKTGCAPRLLREPMRSEGPQRQPVQRFAATKVPDGAAAIISTRSAKCAPSQNSKAGQREGEHQGMETRIAVLRVGFPGRRHGFGRF